MTIINLIPKNDEFLVEVDRKIIGSFSPESSYLYLDFGDLAKEIKEDIRKKFGFTPDNLDIEINIASRESNVRGKLF